MPVYRRRVFVVNGLTLNDAEAGAVLAVGIGVVVGRGIALDVDSSAASSRSENIVIVA